MRLYVSQRARVCVWVRVFLRPLVSLRRLAGRSLVDFSFDSKSAKATSVSRTWKHSEAVAWRSCGSLTPRHTDDTIPAHLCLARVGNVSGPQPPGHGAVLVRGWFGTGPHRKNKQLALLHCIYFLKTELCFFFSCFFFLLLFVKINSDSAYDSLLMHL